MDKSISLCLAKIVSPNPVDEFLGECAGFHKFNEIVVERRAVFFGGICLPREVDQENSLRYNEKSNFSIELPELTFSIKLLSPQSTEVRLAVGTAIRRYSA